MDTYTDRVDSQADRPASVRFIPAGGALQRRVRGHLEESAQVTMAAVEQCEADIMAAAQIIAGSMRAGGKLLLCGNGGSAADCQHLATEFVSRLTKDFERPALGAIALTTDTSFLTAFANDCGFGGIFQRQVEALGGRSPTPWISDGTRREQGIGKAGNRRVRSMIVEVSWLWLRYQPLSALSRWFQRKFGQGGKRMHKVGIVALARKLLIALWHYVEHGVLPIGAVEA